MTVPQLVDTGFQVLFHSPPGVLFTFPSQYFPLSVTEEYLALRGGPRSFPQGFTCPVVLWIILVAFSFQLQGYYLLWRSFPTLFIYDIASMLYVRNPNEVNFIGLACSAFARRYLRNRCFFLFLRLLRCFSSAGSPHAAMDLPHDDRGFHGRVSPFGHRRVTGYLLLSAAFRSLSRPSSAQNAKASSLCPFLLNLCHKASLMTAAG